MYELMGILVVDDGYVIFCDNFSFVILFIEHWQGTLCSFELMEYFSFSERNGVNGYINWSTLLLLMMVL